LIAIRCAGAINTFKNPSSPTMMMRSVAVETTKKLIVHNRHHLRRVLPASALTATTTERICRRMMSQHQPDATTNHQENHPQDHHLVQVPQDAAKEGGPQVVVVDGAPPAQRTDHFAHRSQDYDKAARREKNAAAIATAIIERIPSLNKTMHLMDFGAGTGLLSQKLASHVGRITAVDSSPAMLEVFQSKEFDCETHVIAKDLVVEDDHSIADGNRIIFDGIVSSMTLHHIHDTSLLLSKMYQWTRPGGFIALADLDKEDGSFHDEAHKPGVEHHGFDRTELERITSQAGFHKIHFDTADILQKPQGEFPIFLMTAFRPE
jgi:2-polyprenyl-3-methyl-5-hydroxy-6-metoxy-1,4-benzoquinol methylase